MNRRIYVWGFLLSLAAPNAALAISGCNANSMKGLFDAQFSNSGLQVFLKNLRGAKDGSNPATGFAGNPSSLVGNQPGIGRYFFDGNGNIVGQAAVTGNAKPYNAVIGKYTVNSDCTGKVTMNSGAAYDVVILQGGHGAFYVRTDADGAGNIGTLTHTGACNTLTAPVSYGFSFAGANGTEAAKAGPYSGIGAITLLGNGGFSLTESLYSNGGVQRVTSSGTYSVGADCAVSLKFAGNSTPAPVAIQGLMVDKNVGLISVLPDKDTALAGTLIIQ